MQIFAKYIYKCSILIIKVYCICHKIVNFNCFTISLLSNSRKAIKDLHNNS